MDTRLRDNILHNLRYMQKMHKRRPNLFNWMEYTIHETSYRGYIPIRIHTVDKLEQHDDCEWFEVVLDVPASEHVSLGPTHNYYLAPVNIFDHYEDDDLLLCANEIYDQLDRTFYKLEMMWRKLVHLERHPNDHKTAMKLDRAGKERLTKMKTLYKELKKVDPNLLERLLSNDKMTGHVGTLTVLSFSNASAEKISSVFSTRNIHWTTLQDLLAGRI